MKSKLQKLQNTFKGERNYPMKTEKDLDGFFDQLAKAHLDVLTKGEDTQLAPWLYLVTGYEQNGKPVIVDVSLILRQEMANAARRFSNDDRAPVEAMYYCVDTISNSVRPVAVLLQHTGWQLSGVELGPTERPKHHKDRQHVMLSQMVALNKSGQLYKSYTQTDVIEKDKNGNFIKYGENRRIDVLASEKTNDDSYSRFEEVAVWATT